MSNQLALLQEATVRQHCKMLRMPMMGSQLSSLAEQAVRENKNHIGYPEALLDAEVEERERNTVDRRIKEAHLPGVKTLEEFDYNHSPMVTAAKMLELAEGGYIERTEPVLRFPVVAARAQSRNDEDSIMVHTAPKPAPFEEESGFFKSIT